MNKLKRKYVLKVLNSGHSANNIFDTIALILGQPNVDIEKLIINCKWDKKRIMAVFNTF